jgi:hypothetical protein
MALLDALVVFRLSPAGFTTRMLREHLAPLLGTVPAAMTAGAMTYDLRRLRLHGLITRIPHTHRYTVTVVSPCGKRGLNLTHLVTKHPFKPSRDWYFCSSSSARTEIVDGCSCSAVATVMTQPHRSARME